MKFRKKPVVIDATRWEKNGDHPNDFDRDKVGLEHGEIKTWSGAEVKANGWEGQVVRYFRNPNQDGTSVCRHCARTMHYHGWIETLEGGHIVCPGDWIITGVNGENYPCKPDIFEKTYEPVKPMQTPDNAQGRLTEKLMAAITKRIGKIPTHNHNAIYSAIYETLDAESNLPAGDFMEIIGSELKKAGRITT